MKITGATEGIKPLAYKPPQQSQDSKQTTLPGEVVESGKQDSVQISKQGREESRGMTKVDADEIRSQAEAAKKQAEAFAKGLEDFAKCMKIASYISSGDKVAQQDENFLAENQPDMYMRAISMRMQKEDPDELKRITEDEESEGEQMAQGMEAPSLPTSGDMAGGECIAPAEMSDM